MYISSIQTSSFLLYSWQCCWLAWFYRACRIFSLVICAWSMYSAWWQSMKILLAQSLKWPCYVSVAMWTLMERSKQMPLKPLCCTIVQLINATYILCVQMVLFVLQFNSTLLKLVFVFFHLCYEIHQVLEASKKNLRKLHNIRADQESCKFKCNFHLDEKYFSVTNPEIFFFPRQLKSLYFKVWSKSHTEVVLNLLNSDQLDTSCCALWSLLNLAF